ncbi:hypothetical protein FALBO_17261 [Fusarium albosuccineum]|uniref:Uncharacterized protein n=1 Tax=Fusarium albosuccineum TaxID=1237068 RepID=A0A8H4NM92_9HYPO|nr:hypothetical protein FALBO_17261 [Fusarium albosuccineum]
MTGRTPTKRSRLRSNFSSVGLVASSRIDSRRTRGIDKGPAAPLPDLAGFAPAAAAATRNIKTRASWMASGAKQKNRGHFQKNGPVLGRLSPVVTNSLPISTSSPLPHHVDGAAQCFIDRPDSPKGPLLSEL